MHDNTGQRCTRAGKEIARPRGTPTPCYNCPKGPVPFEGELSPKNYQAYELYLQCKAGRPSPEDLIVYRNHGLFRMIEDSVDRNGNVAVRTVAGAIEASMA